MNRRLADFLNDVKYALPALVVLYGAFMVFGFLLKSCTPKLPLTPREKNGVDTVYTQDSAYIIHFKIDSVYEQEQVDHDDGN
jgi:hypothetical protein